MMVSFSARNSILALFKYMVLVNPTYLHIHTPPVSVVCACSGKHFRSSKIVLFLS